MTFPFSLDQLSPVGKSTRARLSPFWVAQSIVWAVYGTVLMVPWLGTYTVSSMVPNKIAIAVTGMLFSGAIRALYHWAQRAGIEKQPTMVVVVVAALVAGMLWSSSLSVLLGGSHALDLRPLGGMAAGVPQLSGALYHVLVMLAWSMGYLGIRASLQHDRVREAGADVPTAPPVELNIQEAPTAHDRVVLRDGRRTIVLRATEIEWLESDGDYVRVHAGSRHLLIRSTLARALDALPGRDFIRIHRSTVVRVSEVRELLPRPNSEYDVVLRNGRRVRASRTYSEAVRGALGL